MKKGLTELVFILDRSGSMGGLESDTIDIVKPLTDEDYYVRGCTALLDTVGSTVKKVENIQNRLPEELQAEKIIFVITTDGQENSSQEYSAKMVKKMIEKNQEKGVQLNYEADGRVMSYMRALGCLPKMWMRRYRNS